MFRKSPEKTSGKKFVSLFFLVTLFPLISGNQEAEEPSGKGWVTVLLNGRMGCLSPTGLLSHCHPTLLCVRAEALTFRFLAPDPHASP